MDDKNTRAIPLFWQEKNWNRREESIFYGYYNCMHITLELETRDDNVGVMQLLAIVREHNYSFHTLSPSMSMIDAVLHISSKY